MTRKLQATGPHNQRMASLNQRVSGKEIYQIFSNKSEDPLKLLIDKYKRQARNNEPYPQEHLSQQIQPLDKLLEYNSRLAPILTSLQKQNNTLRGQISILSNELSKSLSLSETLISENKQLKDIILNKNQDLTKIIETIAINETQMRGELEHKNYLLQQENSILIKHLEQIKGEKSGWNDQISQLEEEATRLTHRLVGCEANLQQSLSREKDISKRLYINQQNMGELNDQLSQLRRELEDKILDNNRLKNQISLVKVNDSTSIKDKFQSQIAGIIQEYQVLKQERVQIVKQAQKLRVENEHWHNKANNLERELEKSISNLELTNALLTQQKTKSANLTSNNSKMQIRITQLKSNNENMRFELERGQNISSEKEKMYQREIDNLRVQIDERNRELDRKLKQIKQNADSEINRKLREIEDLRRNNEQLKDMLERR